MMLINATSGDPFSPQPETTASKASTLLVVCKTLQAYRLSSINPLQAKEICAPNMNSSKEDIIIIVREIKAGDLECSFFVFNY